MQGPSKSVRNASIAVAAGMGLVNQGFHGWAAGRWLTCHGFDCGAAYRTQASVVGFGALGGYSLGLEWAFMLEPQMEPSLLP